MLVPDKRAALYTTEVVETDGERERVTTASRFNMPSVFKFTADFAKALKEVAERGSARCTSTMKKTASQCLLWGIHVNSCIGAFAEDVAIPHLQNLLPYVLAQDSGLRSFGVRSNMSQTIVRHLQTQLKTILRDHWDIIAAQMVFGFRCEGAGVTLRIISIREIKYD